MIGNRLETANMIALRHWLRCYPKITPQRTPDTMHSNRYGNVFKMHDCIGSYRKTRAFFSSNPRRAETGKCALSRQERRAELSLKDMVRFK